MVSTRRAIDWAFRSRETGRITIAQFPNAALWIFLATVVARRLVGSDGTGRLLVDIAGFGSLSWWALDEIIRGVNPWRRLLGVGGLVSVALGISSLLN